MPYNKQQLKNTNKGSASIAYIPACGSDEVKRTLHSLHEYVLHEWVFKAKILPPTSTEQMENRLLKNIPLPTLDNNFISRFSLNGIIEMIDKSNPIISSMAPIIKTG